MFYYLLTLQYDGYDYHGWVVQKNAQTIQGELEKAFFSVCQLKIWTLGASKTDQQVHAEDQKVLVKLPFKPYQEASFFRSVNHHLPANIYVKNYQPVAENFNVRRAEQKIYHYLINDQTYDYQRYRYEYFYPRELDLKKLNTIAQLFVGEHDFRFYSGVKDHENVNTLRVINKIEVIRNEQNRVCIKIYGPSFIRYQIRMIVGIILACYENKIRMTELQEKLTYPPQQARSRFCLPGYGLVLVKISYEAD